MPPSASRRHEADSASRTVMYSFRCTREMDERLEQLMWEHGLNRTSVIRLSLYLLDCFTQQEELRGASLRELLRHIDALAPGRNQGIACISRRR